MALAALVLLVGMAIWALAWSSEGASAGPALVGGDGGGSYAPWLSAPGGALVVPGVNDIDQGEQAWLARRSQLLDPQAVLARQRSRYAYSKLGPGGINRLLSASFPNAVDRSAGEDNIPAGARVARYLSARSALISLPDKRHGVLEALHPLARPTGKGRFAGIDLALRASGIGFAPVAPAVDVRIPHSVSEGVSAPGNGVSLIPVGGDERPLVGSSGEVDGATVVYANTATASDTLARPTPEGFQLDATLRSVESPQQLRYRVDVPAGSRVVQNGSGGAVRIVRGRAVIGAILPPGAQDSAGSPVPVSMALEGRTIVLTVAHRSGSYLYPIDVDPEYNDHQLAKGPAEKRSNWEFKSSNEAVFQHKEAYEGSEKEWLETSAASTYKATEVAYWGYQTQGISKIYELKAETEAKNTGGKIESFLEFQKTGGTEETKELLSTEAEHTTEYSRKAAAPLCAANSKGEQECLPAAGAEKNAVHFQQSATGEGNKFSDRLYQGIVSISEPTGTHATTSFNTTSPELEFEVENGGKKEVQKRKNALYGSGSWLSKYQGALELLAEDPGIGVSDTKLEYESTPGKWEQLSEHNYLEKESACKGIQCYQKHSEAWTLNSKLPNGEDKIRYRAEEAMPETKSLETEGKATIKVDNSPPEGLTINGLPGGNELSERAYKVTGEATDGEGSIPSSGVASIALFVHGHELTRTGGTGKCTVARGPCTATGEWTINGSELGAGHDEIVLVAIDNAGNEARLPETLTVRHSTPVALGPGSVDLESGNFSLGATDVELGSGLTVSRVYSSRNLTAGEEGPLGPQWTMSLGNSTSLRELIDGGVLMTSANGGQAIFAPLGGGKFESPQGDSNLALSLEENGAKEKLAYYLKDAADGSQTKFTLPTGSKLWMPTKQEGTVPTDQVTFKYETVEVGGKKVTRPTEALAPVPAGVSCAPELKAGCQNLTFTYSTSTTATGEKQSEWGEYVGRLYTVTYSRYNNVEKRIVGSVVAKYRYDPHGRLRSVSDPQITTAFAMKIYGYDSEGHVTSYKPVAEQPWQFVYGTTAQDAGTGRVMKVTRDSTSAGTWGGELPANTAAPNIVAGTTPVVGSTILVERGTWTGSVALTYGWEWEDCNATGGECKRILGANGPNYKIAPSDVGHTLVAVVTAIDPGAAVAASSAHTAEVTAGEVTTYGAGKESQLSAITTGPGKTLWVTDFWANKVYKYETSGAQAAAYSLPVFKGDPEGIAAGSDGNLWITDLANGGNVMKMTPSGSFTEYKMPAESYPHSIVAGPDGNLWFTDSNHNKIDKMTTAGVKTEYSLPSGSNPYGIAVGPDGNLWFTDANSNKIGKITTSGEVLAEYALPSGSYPWSITAGPDGNLWFTDCSSSKIGKITTSGVIAEYALPAESCPRGITADPINGTLWFAEHQSSKLGIITTSGAIAEYSLAAGTDPEAITLGPDENAWFTTDKGTIELGKINLHLLHVEEATAEPSWTMDYNVPISGSSAPYQMNKSSVAAWGQTKDDPTEATAIFPPDSPQYWPPSNFTRASIYYLDENGRIVNTASPTHSEYGSISTTEYNEYNDVVRTLSPTNRIAALESGSEKSVATSKLLDTQQTYNGEGAKEGEVSEPGTRLIETLGPQHMVKYIAGGKTYNSLARNHKKYFYDEGAPSGETFDLVTKTTDLVQLANEEEVEVRKTATSYSGQEGLGWKLRAPTSVTVDPEGLKITSSTLYNKETGQVTETRGPEGASGNSAHDMRTVYYSSEENKEEEFKSCGLHPEWAGLVCKTLPAKQPSGGPAPQLPVTETTYAELWNKPGKVVEKFGPTITRTTTYAYDKAGRITKREVASNEAKDTALPSVEFTYNLLSGKLQTIKPSTGKEIKMEFNSLGQLETYEDGSGNVAKYHYAVATEGDDLLEEVTDSSAGNTTRQTYAYDPTTKALTKLQDSAAGTFTASYGPAGELTSEVYPNGMCANYTYNSVGEATNLEYIKTTNCSESKAAVWFSESLGVSARGETLSRTNTLGGEVYGYDAAKRLTETQETPTGEGCVSRVYAYNEESDRTKLTTRAPGSKGECTTTGGTVEEHTYDEGNRLTDTGIAYDGLGNITKLPAADAEGHELSTTYYVDNAVATQTQNGVTNEYVLDAEGRVSQTKTGGKTAITHYDSLGGTVAWTCPENAGKCEESKETRDIPGIDGTLAAVQTNGELPVLQLRDLQGNVVATASLSSEATKLASTYNPTEFGVPNAGKTPPKYAWLGASGFSTELASGVITDGSTSYVPQIGKALQGEEVEPPGLPEGSGAGAAVVWQEEAWNMQGATREGHEAPGLEAAREREAAEAACRANPSACGSGGQVSEIDPIGCVGTGGLNETQEWDKRGSHPYLNIKCRHSNPDGYLILCIQEGSFGSHYTNLSCSSWQQIGKPYANGKDFAIMLPTFECDNGLGVSYRLAFGGFEYPMAKPIWGYGKEERCNDDLKEIAKQGIEDAPGPSRDG